MVIRDGVFYTVTGPVKRNSRSIADVDLVVEGNVNTWLLLLLMLPLGQPVQYSVSVFSLSRAAVSFLISFVRVT